MRLKFKISQSTNLAPQIIVDRILAALKDKKYRLIDSTDTYVEFDDDPWVLRWRHEAVRLDGGKFEVNLSDKPAIVTFIYYLNLIPFLLCITVPCLITLTEGLYYGALYFLLFGLGALCFQIFTSKGVAKNMLNSIFQKNILNTRNNK